MEKWVLNSRASVDNRLYIGSGPSANINAIKNQWEDTVKGVNPSVWESARRYTMRLEAESLRAVSASTLNAVE